MGQPASEGDVEGVIAESAYQGLLFPGEEGSKESFGIVKTRKRGVVRARSAAQDHYLAALRKHELVFAEGPAGTGKTWLAVGHAVSLLEQGLVERLVLSRPAVEAGERLGFLPGDMRDKVDPYLRPIYDALYDFMDGRMVERGMQTGMIEIAPLAFMRGRTLSKAAILLDEAQNATAMQMKMFLTRLGEGSRMMVNGDPSQTDLAPGQKSGLSDAIRLLASLPRIGHVRFTHVDVVRHDLVRQIVEAYERAGREGHHRRQMKVKLDISVPSPLWRGLPRARGLARETIAACVAETEMAREARRSSLCLADDARLRAFNLRWRGIDKPTNVLSFPSGRARPLGEAPTLGDIALAYETLKREAEELDVPLADRYRHLVAHGFLHLIGYDHQTDEEAERMEALETRILAQLGAADPYALKVVEG